MIIWLVHQTALNFAQQARCGEKIPCPPSYTSEVVPVYRLDSAVAGAVASKAMRAAADQNAINLDIVTSLVSFGPRGAAKCRNRDGPTPARAQVQNKFAR